MSAEHATLVARTLNALRGHGTPARAAGAAAYFKAYEHVRFFGVDSATVRRLAAQVQKDDGRDWTLREAVAFTDAMMARPELEAKGVGICVLGRFRAQFEPSLLAQAKRWLTQRCTDWASCDTLCGEVIAPLLARYPSRVPTLRRWRSSRALYVQRASAVALIPLARKGQALDEAYAAAHQLGTADHHLLQKAAGWLLREAGKADAARLESFLRQSGRALSRTTVSYAIERFPPRARKALLAATRGA
jgi:3-methyladenine DNA glycosylase AlkD